MSIDIYVLFVCRFFVNNQSALSSSPTFRKRYINPSYYYIIIQYVFEIFSENLKWMIQNFLNQTLKHYVLEHCCHIGMHYLSLISLAAISRIMTHVRSTFNDGRCSGEMPQMSGGEWT